MLDNEYENVVAEFQPLLRMHKLPTEARSRYMELMSDYSQAFKMRTAAQQKYEDAVFSDVDYEELTEIYEILMCTIVRLDIKYVQMSDYVTRCLLKANKKEGEEMNTETVEMSAAEMRLRLREVYNQTEDAYAVALDRFDQAKTVDDAAARATELHRLSIARNSMLQMLLAVDDTAVEVRDRG